LITEGKLHTEKSIDIINTMHKAISNIFKERERKSYEYVGDFLLTISMALAAMEFFPYHIIWEFVSEKNSTESPLNEKIYLRDVTDDGYVNSPEGDRKTFFKEEIGEYWELPYTKYDFISRAKRAVRNNQLTTIFDLPIREEYSYFNLPVFPWVEGSEDKSEPNWVITAIYNAKDDDIFESKSSFKFMKFFSDQISLSWKKFWESSAQKVHIKIDGEIDNLKKDEQPTVEKELEITTKVLAEEFRSEFCALFLFNEQKNILQMEFDNIGISQKPRYQLNRDFNIIIKCFKENKVFRISGRGQIVRSMNLDPILMPFEEKKPIEHCLCIPINSGKTKVGVIVLLRPTPPYTEFVTNMLINILSQLSDVVLSYFTIQRREKDLRNIIDQITKGMDSAHKEGVIHRDMKPANILINEEGLVKVVDFGIAAAARNSETRLTKTGTLVGTPTYIAPEQVLGKPVDNRTDIYSLGIIMYEMLSGKPPYQGEDYMSLMYQHVQGGAPLLYTVNPKISKTLSAVVAKAMATEPDKRYQTMDELRQRVELLMQE